MDAFGAENCLVLHLFFPLLHTDVDGLIICNNLNFTARCLFWFCCITFVKNNVGIVLGSATVFSCLCTVYAVY
jgi:hypothetical protein